MVNDMSGWELLFPLVVIVFLVYLWRHRPSYEVLLFEPTDLEATPTWFQEYARERTAELTALGFQIDQTYRQRQRRPYYDLLLWHAEKRTLAEVNGGPSSSGYVEFISLAADGRAIVTACSPRNLTSQMAICGVGSFTHVPITFKADWSPDMGKSFAKHCQLAEGYAATAETTLLPIDRASIKPFSWYVGLLVYRQMTKVGMMSRNPYDARPEVLASLPFSQAAGEEAVSNEFAKSPSIE